MLTIRLGTEFLERNVCAISIGVAFEIGFGLVMAVRSILLELRLLELALEF